MRSVRISWKHARSILTALKEHPELSADDRSLFEARVALNSALEPRPAVVAAKKVRVAKRAARRDKTATVRAIVAKRAGQTCECGCERRFQGEGEGRATLDHFEGRARSETPQTCWMLRAGCHERKTNSSPDRASWIQRFLDHCRKHGYRLEQRRWEDRLESRAAIESLRVVR